MRLVRVIAVGSLVAAQSAAAQKSSTMLESYQKARTLIEAAVAAHGGIDALKQARKAQVSIRGWDYHPTQGRRVAPPFDSTVRNIDAQFDLDRGALVYQQTTGWPGGFHYTNRFITRGDSTFVVRTRDHNYSIVTAARAEQQFGNLFTLPQWYLLAAHENVNPAIRRYLGRMRLPSGAEVEAVHFTLPPQGNVVIGIDPATHRLRGTMSVGTDVFLGDTEITTEFHDWRMIGGLLLPSRATLHRGGNTTRELRYVAAAAVAQIPDSLLSPPPGFTLAPPNPQPAVSTELAPGVWLVGQGSRSLVVAFNDHLVAVDAPSGGSAGAIATAATLAPGKPIRYVVPTHHHDDHFMGVRYHAANGSTIVTTPGNTDYLRRIMTAPMNSVMLPANQVPPSSTYRSEILSGDRRVFSDGSRTLEIHRIASPHAEEMLIAWLPAEGILFQADLIETGAGGHVSRGANAAATTHLADVIRQKGWNVRMFAGAHGTLQRAELFAELTRLPIIPPGQ